MIYCLSETKISCQINIQTIYKLLGELAFIINREKSNLNPNLKCKYLEFNLNSVNMSKRLSIEKKVRLTRFAGLKIRKYVQSVSLPNSSVR